METVEFDYDLCLLSGIDFSYEVKGNEVIVTIQDNRPVGEQGHILMALERYLRAATGESYEVYSPSAPDSNTHRKAVWTPMDQRIANWVKRRAEMKNEAHPA